MTSWVNNTMVRATEL
jgi:hypothetical protein